MGPHPLQPEPSGASSRGGGQVIGTQSLVSFGAGTLGCRPGPHLKALHRDWALAPWASVVPRSGQGWHVEADVLPSTAEKVFTGHRRQGEEPRVTW